MLSLRERVGDGGVLKRDVVERMLDMVVGVQAYRCQPLYLYAYEAVEMTFSIKKGGELTICQQQL
jgi:hypothetical protein